MFLLYILTGAGMLFLRPKKEKKKKKALSTDQKILKTFEEYRQKHKEPIRALQKLTISGLTVSVEPDGEATWSDSSGKTIVRYPYSTQIKKDEYLAIDPHLWSLTKNMSRIVVSTFSPLFKMGAQDGLAISFAPDELSLYFVLGERGYVYCGTQGQAASVQFTHLTKTWMDMLHARIEEVMETHGISEIYGQLTSRGLEITGTNTQPLLISFNKDGALVLAETEFEKELAALINAAQLEKILQSLKRNKSKLRFEFTEGTYGGLEKVEKGKVVEILFQRA